MQKKIIELSRTHRFPKLIIDYLQGSENLRNFYTYPPSVESFPKAIEDKSTESINRDLLVEVLKEQYSKLSSRISNLVVANLNLLAESQTYTVTTGHQLCLFTGPLYFIYKILSTIRLAEELNKKYMNYNFVPVYWMASEDHDFEEVSSINIFGKKLEWKENHKSIPTGLIKTGSVNQVLHELKELIKNEPRAGELLELFHKSYIENKNLADATRYLVNELFGEYGLIIIDPQDKRLKKEFADIIKDDIFEHVNYKAVHSATQELKKYHIKPQVNPREINCFYLYNGARDRIEKTGGSGKSTAQYSVLNTEIVFNREQLTGEINHHPERFSPNVVLRPLYQQKILPNLAYIGGPGELSYWLEYKAMFQEHKISFPVLMLRNSVMWVDGPVREKLEKLDIDSPDLFLNEDEIIKNYLEEHTPAELNLEREKEKLQDLYARIAKRVEEIDTTLKSSIDAELQKQLNALKSIEQKLLRSEKQKQETAVNQIRKIREKLFPGGSLQERHDNFIPYYLKYGKEFIPALKENLNPWAKDFIILEA